MRLRFPSRLGSAFRVFQPLASVGERRQAIADHLGADRLQVATLQIDRALVGIEYFELVIPIR